MILNKNYFCNIYKSRFRKNEIFNKNIKKGKNFKIYIIVTECI